MNFPMVSVLELGPSIEYTHVGFFGRVILLSINVLVEIVENLPRKASTKMLEAQLSGYNLKALMKKT